MPTCVGNIKTLVRTDRHALYLGGDETHRRRDVQHLHRIGQPVMREPERTEAGIPNGQHLINDFEDLFRHAGGLGKLRVDE